MSPYSLLDYYSTSIEAGARSLWSPYVREAVGRLLNPLSYPRYMEYQLVFRQLGEIDDRRVLDIGSPKLPAVLIARNSRCDLYATDLRDYFIGSTAHFIRRLGAGHRLGRDIHLQTADARALQYGDESFDKVFAISVVEHIPGDGDTDAMREIARVLRPGGVASVTVPFAAVGHHDEFVRGAVFGHENAGGKTFFQRRYDQSTVRSRLVLPSGLTLEETALFGEPRVRFERYWNRIGMRYKLPLLWAQPFLAALFLRELPPEQAQAACGVAIKLRKGPPSPSHDE